MDYNCGTIPQGSSGDWIRPLRVILIRGKDTIVLILPWSLINGCPLGDKNSQAPWLWYIQREAILAVGHENTLWACMHKNGKGTIRGNMGTTHRADSKREPEVTETLTSGSSYHPLGLGGTKRGWGYQNLEARRNKLQLKGDHTTQQMLVPDTGGGAQQGWDSDLEERMLPSWCSCVWKSPVRQDL